MEPRRTYHHGDLKQVMLDQALTALEADGLENLSLRGLAQFAGVSKTAPYRHFKDKEQLLAEVAAEGFAQLAEELEGAGTKGDNSLCGTNYPLSGLEPALRAYVGFAGKRPQLYQLMFSRYGYGLHSDRCRNNADRAMGCLIDAVGTAQTRGWKTDQDPVSLVLSVWSLAHGWAGMLTEKLIPDEVGFNPENWLESCMGLLG